MKLSFNTKRVLTLIRKKGGISRMEIAGELEITKAAITIIVRNLKALGLICEAGWKKSRQGPNRRLLKINENGAYAIGINFSYTRLEGALLNMQGEVLFKKDCKLDGSTLEEFNDKIDWVCSELKNSLNDDPKKIKGMGLAVFGPIDMGRGSIMSLFIDQNWRNTPIRKQLSKKIGMEVYMDNNATCASIGSYWFGFGKDYGNFLFLYFSEYGLGSGLFLENKVYRGSRYNSAEVGLMPFGMDKNGRFKMVEEIVSNNSLISELGNDYQGQENLLRKWQEKDPALMNWLKEKMNFLSRLIACIDLMLDLDAVIIGGKLPLEMLQFFAKNYTGYDFYPYGYLYPAKVIASVSKEDMAVKGAAMSVLYDMFTPN